MVHLLWAARALLLNDSNYFPQLQATHACFIRTSTFPICLYGHALHQRFPNLVLESRHPDGISVLPGRPRFQLGTYFLWGGRTQNQGWIAVHKGWVWTALFIQLEKQNPKQNNKAFYASLYLIKSLYWFPEPQFLYRGAPVFYGT